MKFFSLVIRVLTFPQRKTRRRSSISLKRRQRFRLLIWRTKRNTRRKKRCKERSEKRRKGEGNDGMARSEGKKKKWKCLEQWWKYVWSLRGHVLRFVCMNIITIWIFLKRTLPAPNWEGIELFIDKFGIQIGKIEKCTNRNLYCNRNRNFAEKSKY